MYGENDDPYGKKCWWCTRGMVDEGLVFPLKARRVPAGGEGGAEGSRWEFKGYGYFHNLQCLRAYAEDCRRRAIEIPDMDALLLLYAQELRGVKELPPPALPRELLHEYGGPYGWAEWRRRSLEGGRMEAWRSDVCVRDELSRFGERRAAETWQVRMRAYGGVDGAGTVGCPGETHVFDSLLVVHRHASYCRGEGVGGVTGP
jgi:hypothetical protein